MNLGFIKPQNLGSLLMKSSQSNFDLRSPKSQLFNYYCTKMFFFNFDWTFKTICVLRLQFSCSELFCHSALQCGLVDDRIGASDKDLLVVHTFFFYVINEKIFPPHYLFISREFRVTSGLSFSNSNLLWGNQEFQHPPKNPTYYTLCQRPKNCTLCCTGTSLLIRFLLGLISN